MKFPIEAKHQLIIIGGDEFVVLLYQTNQTQAKLIVDRIRSHLTQEMAPLKTRSLYSIGAVTCDANSPVSAIE